MHISPGIAAMYWLLASAITTAVIARAAHTLKRTAHRATARCHCGMCQR